MFSIKQHLSGSCAFAALAFCFLSSAHASVLNEVPESGHLIYKKRYSINLAPSNSSTKVCGPHYGLSLAWHPRKKQIAVSVVSGFTDRRITCKPITQSVKVFDLSGESPKQLHTIADQSYPSRAVAYNTEGDQLAASVDNEVHIHDALNGTLLHTIGNKDNRTILDVAYSPDGNKLAVSGTWIYDTSNSSVPYQLIHKVKEVRNSEVIKSLAFNPDGTYLAEGGTTQKGALKHHRLQVYSMNGSLPFNITSDYTMNYPVKTGTEGIETVEFLNDTRLVSGSDDGVLRFYDISSESEPEEPVLVFNDSSSAITSISADRKNQRLAVVGEDALFKIYDMNLLSVSTISLDNKNTSIQSVAFAPSNPNWLAITGTSERLDIYELALNTTSTTPASGASSSLAPISLFSMLLVVLLL